VRTARRRAGEWAARTTHQTRQDQFNEIADVPRTRKNKQGVTNRKREINSPTTVYAETFTRIR